MNDVDFEKQKKLWKKDYDGRYYREHKLLILKRNKSYLECHKGQRKVYIEKYRVKNRKHMKDYQRNYYFLHEEKIKARRVGYLVRNRKHVLERNRNYMQVLRFRALMMVGKGILRCSNCGCNDLRFVEVNHKDGGGSKELKHRSYRFYRDIIDGTRKIDNLNLLCKVCNHAYYVKLKYGINYSVEYVGGKKVAV